MDNIGLKDKYSLKMNSITVINLKALAKQRGINATINSEKLS